MQVPVPQYRQVPREVPVPVQVPVQVPRHIQVPRYVDVRWVLFRVEVCSAQFWNCPTISNTQIYSVTIG